MGRASDRENAPTRHKEERQRKAARKAACKAALKDCKQAHRDLGALKDVKVRDVHVIADRRKVRELTTEWKELRKEGSAAELNDHLDEVLELTQDAQLKVNQWRDQETERLEKETERLEKKREKKARPTDSR